MAVAIAVFVSPADLRVRRGHGLLTCVGLRTGACLCLYDPVAKVAGMAHVTHADPDVRTPYRPGMYAPSALEALIQAMERTGGFRPRLIATVVGGAEVRLRGEGEEDSLLLDSGVCRCTLLELERNGIPLAGTDVGGREDRSVVLDVATGLVRVKTGETDQVLCELNVSPARAMAA